MLTLIFSEGLIDNGIFKEQVKVKNKENNMRIFDMSFIKYKIFYSEENLPMYNTL